MTAINIDFAGKHLSAEQKAELADRLTEAFARIETGQDNEVIRGGFLTCLREVGADDLWIGAKRMVDLSPSGCGAHVTVRVMAGPWIPEMKAQLFAEFDAVIRDVAGMKKEGMGQDIWMTIVEVPDGGWGVGGNAITIGQIAPMFDAERQQRIEAYRASDSVG